MEPANFCDDFRIALRFMKDHLDLKKSVFKGRKFLRFRRKGTEWKEIEKRSGYYCDENLFEGREILDLLDDEDDQDEEDDQDD